MLQFVYLSIFVGYLDLYIGLTLILYEKDGSSPIFVGEEKTNGSIWRKRQNYANISSSFSHFNNSS